MLTNDGSDMLRSRGLKIAHLNVASILGAHKFEMMKVQVKDSNLDVFCASETWLTPHAPDKVIHKGM